MYSLTSTIYSCKGCFLGIIMCLKKLCHFYFILLKTFSRFLIASGTITIPPYIFNKSTLELLRDFYYVIAIPVTDKVRDKATKSIHSVILEERNCSMASSRDNSWGCSHWSLPDIQGLLLRYFPQGEPSAKHSVAVLWNRATASMSKFIGLFE